MPTDADLAAILAIDMLGAVLRALDAMPVDRHVVVVRKRLGLDESSPLPLARIGDELGVTRERVRQLEVNAMPRLKRAVLADPAGAESVRQLTAVLAPGSPGYEDRVAAATSLLCPDWPARAGRRIVMALAGRTVQVVLDDNRPLHLVRDGVVAAGETAPDGG